MVDQKTGYSISRYLDMLKIFVYIIWAYIKWIYLKYTTKTIDTYSCLVGKTAIVTGGSTGLGYAASMMLASRGCRVIIATNVECEREKNKLIGITKNPNIITKYLDLGSLDSVRKFAEEINETEKKIDFLLNNAGVGLMKDYISVDKLNIVMQINYLGHFLLTHLLVGKLKAAASARVVFVSSAASYIHKMEVHKLNKLPKNSAELVSDLDCLEYYANSKFCTIVAAEELGRRLKKNSIMVNTVDPGFVRTNIVQQVFDYKVLFGTLFFLIDVLCRTDVHTAVKNTIYTLTGDDIETGEHYFQCNPIHKPYEIANFELCEKIWERSEELVKLRSEEKIHE